MPNVMKKVPKQVADLIKHLKDSGTGESKLSKLEELSKVCRDGAEFLASAKLAVPPGTWAKIETYLAENGGGQGIKTAAEEQGRVESRSESQSSTPELTILVENKSVQLREPNSTKTRQLGKDIIVDPETDPLADESEGDDESGDEGEEESGNSEESPVADRNATEAIDAISRMTSKDRLESIVVNEKRTSVAKAAQKRLEELNK